MLTPLLADFLDIRRWLTSPPTLLLGAFQVWMLIDAIRRKEWMWVLFMLVLPGFSAFWYYFSVYRAAPSATRGFQLPGAHDRRRIEQLQAQIHHLDKPHHYFQLGDIYFRQGKLDQAETCYRAALELRDSILSRAVPAEALLLQPITANSAGELFGDHVLVRYHGG